MSDHRERMKNAYDAVKAGMPVRKASREFGVPRTTLRDKLCQRSPLVKKTRTFLSWEEEIKFSKWAINMSRSGLGVTRKQFFDTIQSYLEQLDEPYQRFKNGNRPAKTWYYNFLKRHPELKDRCGRVLEEAPPSPLTCPSTSASLLPSASPSPLPPALPTSSASPSSSAVPSSPVSPLPPAVSSATSEAPVQTPSMNEIFRVLEAIMTEDVRVKFERRLAEGYNLNNDPFYNAWRDCKLLLPTSSLSSEQSLASSLVRVSHSSSTSVEKSSALSLNVNVYVTATVPPISADSLSRADTSARSLLATSSSDISLPLASSPTPSTSQQAPEINISFPTKMPSMKQKKKKRLVAPLKIVLKDTESRTGRKLRKKDTKRN